jgi:hypothetical protein
MTLNVDNLSQLDHAIKWDRVPQSEKTETEILDLVKILEGPRLMKVGGMMDPFPRLWNAGAFLDRDMSTRRVTQEIRLGIASEFL